MKAKAVLLLLVFLALAGCGGLASKTPEALPTVNLDQGQSSTQTAGQASAAIAVASGVLVPLQEVKLASGTGGIVETVNVKVGDAVKKGDPIILLSGREQYVSALSAAELAALTAQQNLDKLNENADLVRAEAQQTLADAQDDLEKEQHHRAYIGIRHGSDEQIAAAHAAYILAQDKVDYLQNKYNNKSELEEDDPTRALALANLENAKKERDKALVNLNWYKAAPTELEIAQADADLAVAQARYDEAKAALERMKDGPDTNQLALLQAQLKSAQDAVEAAQANLDSLTLTAPFDGEIGAVYIDAGEYVTYGEVMAVVSDTSKFKVETTDLSERDVANIALGQSVQVSIDALNQEVTGKVSQISPMADTLGGDVVYQTTIELDSLLPEIRARMRAGMTVEVQFLPVEK